MSGAMANPLVIDLPHNLGRDEVVRRMRAQVGALASRLPAGAQVDTSWPSETRMAVLVRVLGQQVNAFADAEDTLVRVTIPLSGMLAMMGGPIAEMVRRTGGKLLADDRG